MSPLTEVISYVRSNWRTFVMHNVGMGFISITGYIASLWDIALFARTYQWPAAESSRIYGLMAMAGSILGALSGGWLADRLTRIRGRDAKILVLGVTATLCIPIRLLYPLMPSRELALGLAFVAVTLVFVPYGVAASALQIMMPSRMRGQLTAVYFFVQSLIGLGVGPTLVGGTERPRVSEPADAALLADHHGWYRADPGYWLVSLSVEAVSEYSCQCAGRRPRVFGLAREFKTSRTPWHFRRDLSMAFLRNTWYAASMSGET